MMEGDGSEIKTNGFLYILFLPIILYFHSTKLYY